MGNTILGFLLGVLATLPFHVRYFYWMRHRYTQQRIIAVEEAKDKAVDNWLATRERQLQDARRSYMPREDAGPPARVRSGLVPRPTRNP